MRLGPGSHNCRCFAHCRNRWNSQTDECAESGGISLVGSLGILRNNSKSDAHLFPKLVDFASEEIQFIEAEGNQTPVARTSDEVSSKTVLRKTGEQRRHWTDEQLQYEVLSADHVQMRSNSVVYAIEKARARAIAQGASQPPAVEDLAEDLMLPELALAGADKPKFGKMRTWDT